MARIADAEKLNGNKHWTVYDGQGGVFRARRDPTSGLWNATRTVVIPGGANVYVGRTLRHVRERIAAGAAR